MLHTQPNPDLSPADADAFARDLEAIRSLPTVVETGVNERTGATYIKGWRS